MNKKQAKDKAYEYKGTYGDLLDMVRSTRGKRSKSIVNKSLTLDQALDIFENWLTEDHINLNDEVKTTKYNRRDQLTLTGDGFSVNNIFRECG